MPHISAVQIGFASLLLSSIGALLALPADSAAQGRLSRARDEARDRPTRTPPAHDDDDDHDHEDDHRDRGRRGGGHHRRGHHGHRHHGHAHHGHFADSCFDDDLETFGAKLCFYALTSPIWAPHLLVDPGLDVPGHYYSQPYLDGHDGVMEIGGFGRPANHHTRFDIEYASDFDGLDRAGGRLLWESTKRFGIDTSANYYHEDLIGGGTDELWIGDANLVYRFAQCETLNMRVGVGVNWMADSDRGDAGFNFTYGADWFPSDPLVVSTELDWGTLNDATIFHGRATVGVMLDHVEVYAGYDYLEIDDARLDGFIAGVRVWFR